ncbi:MAG: hypothetical protein LBI69_02315 [Puniceicoccales bacterium]|jgi:primosomal protein N'|nr:hypothetical protein [Puniceicoccales bacterium]
MEIAVELFDAIGKPFTHSVPMEFEEKIMVGSLVRVPLRKRTSLGVVRGARPCDCDIPIRPIRKLLQDGPTVGSDLMKLANWTCRYYGTPFHAALNMIFPAAIRRKKNWHRLPANAPNENIFPSHRHGCLFSETPAIDDLDETLLKFSHIAKNAQCILSHEILFTYLH